MEQSKAVETIEALRPKTVNLENSLLWASLKQYMEHNEELRKALLEAAETIVRQTDMIELLHEKLDAGKTFKYY